DVIITTGVAWALEFSTCYDRRAVRVHLLRIVPKCATFAYLPTVRRRVDDFSRGLDRTHVDRRELGMNDGVISKIWSPHALGQCFNKSAVKQPVVARKLVCAFCNILEGLRDGCAN